jgi:sodium pump decarboxylase gamma subunit
MLQELEFGLYITAMGMGGVFTILSLLALFMHLMGRVEQRNMKGNMEIQLEEVHEDVHDLEDIINRKEEIAIISAALAYHMEGEADAIPFTSSNSWKRFAREYSLRR